MVSVMPVHRVLVFACACLRASVLACVCLPVSLRVGMMSASTSLYRTLSLLAAPVPAVPARNCDMLTSLTGASISMCFRTNRSTADWVMTPTSRRRPSLTSTTASRCTRCLSNTRSTWPNKGGQSLCGRTHETQWAGRSKVPPCVHCSTYAVHGLGRAHGPERVRVTEVDGSQGAGWAGVIMHGSRVRASTHTTATTKATGRTYAPRQT